MMNHNRFTAPLMALMLLVTAVAGAGVAAAAFDTETTTTTTTSDVSGASNTLTIDWGNSSEPIYVETDGVTDAGSDLTLELSPAQKGVDYVAYSNGSAETVDATNGHFAWTITHDEISEIPRDANGGLYNLTVRNATSGAVVEQTEVDLQTAAGASDDAYLAVTDDANGAMTNLVSDRLTLESKDSGFFSGLAFWSSDNSSTPQVATWSGYTTVNGTASDVVVDLENSSTADAYSSAASDYEDGEWIRGTTMWINGVPHKVYLNEVPDDANGTTVVYSDSSDRITSDLAGSEYENVQTVSLRATAGSGYGFGEVWSNFGTFDALAGLSPV